MASKSLTFDIFGRDKSASKTIRKVGDEAQRSGERFHKAGVAIGIGVAAAGAAVVSFGIDSIKAYAEAEESQNKLAFAFKKFPALADTNQKALQDLNSELQKKTRFDDDDIAASQAQLAQFKLTGSQIKTVTPLILDYAAATGKDLPTAAGVVGKALLGNTKALKAIGIKYTSTGDAAEDFGNVTRLMAEKVGGFAEQEGTTAAGKLDILKNQFGEIQETVGEKLTPALSTLADITTTKLIPALSDLGDSKGIDDFFAAVERHSKNGDLLGFMDPAAWGNGLQQIKNFMNNGEVDPTGTGGPLDPAAWSNGFAQISAIMAASLAEWHEKFENGWNQISVAITGAVASTLAQVVGWWGQLGVASANGLVQIGTYFGQIGPMFQASVDSWGGAFANGWAQINGFFSGITSTISNWGISLAGSAWSAGYSIVRGIADGIGSAIGSVSSAMGDVMATIASFLPHSPAKQGPFSGSGWARVKTSGGALFDQFTGGFGNVDVSASLSRLVPEVSNTAPRVSSVSAAAQYGTQAVYADGMGLVGYITKRANEQAKLVWALQDDASARRLKMG